MTRKNRFTLFGNPIYHPLNVILILNCLAFVIQILAMTPDGIDLTGLIYNWFALRPIAFLNGAYWQIITYGFLHSPFGFIPFHLLMNMYGFYMLGKYIEPFIGKTKLVLLYFTSLIGGGLFIVLHYYLIHSGILPRSSDTFGFTIGASGAVFGMLAVFGLLYPDVELIIFAIPVKAKYAVLASLAVGYILVSFEAIPISNDGHVGGALSGFLFYFLFIRGKLSFAEKRESHPVEAVIYIPEDQTAINKAVIKNLEALKTFSEKEKFLLPRQVANANICPPPTFNPQDNFCLGCEWFSNCALRKERSKENEK